LPWEHRFSTMSRQDVFVESPARTSHVIANNRAPRVMRPAPGARRKKSLAIFSVFGGT